MHLSAAPGLVAGGIIADSGPALMQFDVTTFKPAMDVWTIPLKTLFTTRMNLNPSSAKDLGGGGCSKDDDSDDSDGDAPYPSDDDSPLQEKFDEGTANADDDETSTPVPEKDTTNFDDKQNSKPIHGAETGMRPAKRVGKRDFTKDEVLNKARKCCHIFHLFSGLLPPQLAMNVYKTDLNGYIKIDEMESNIVRFQHYTPIFR